MSFLLLSFSNLYPLEAPVSLSLVTWRSWDRRRRSCRGPGGAHHGGSNGGRADSVVGEWIRWRKVDPTMQGMIPGQHMGASSSVTCASRIGAGGIRAGLGVGSPMVLCLFQSTSKYVGVLQLEKKLSNIHGERR